ncbi:MAG: hypothetical protein EAZ24_12505 [Burkholderiales bacterium]|nr:MAG: hypothetical protein EAZ24_12505 [Burkholderiales bacterium]TAG83920.1 MAG: hypothetical protein EAZ21_01355 [Betaproteobacteria bacterium]
MEEVFLTTAELAKRHLRESDYVADTEAFIDCRLPGSMPKENFSMIGPGVTQSDKQVVNLREPHGFNIGAAGVHPGITNNLHLHFTSETFIAASGAYTLRWGVKGDEGSLPLETGDIAVMPTWMFRGFSSASDEYGFLMTVLGGDDTGGILWSPDVLKRARETGLWLTKDNRLVDTAIDGTPPENESLMPLLSEVDMQSIKRWSAEEIRRRVLKLSERKFCAATLDTACGFQWKLAPAVGFGITQARAHWPIVGEPQGFSIEWATVAPGQSSAAFRTVEKMVIINVFGTLRVRLNRGDQQIECTLAPREILSIPANVWRAFSVDHESAAVAEFLLVLPGDSRKRIEWEDGLVAKALQADAALDADGRIARYSLLPPPMLCA